MSQSCNIFLPIGTSPEDVCRVIGRLIGQPAELKTMQQGGLWVEVEGVASGRFEIDEGESAWAVFMSSPSPTAFQIVVQDNPLDHQHHFATWFWQSTAQPGMVLISGGANRFWQSVGYELVMFFGGYLDMNDEIGQGFDYEQRFKMYNRSNNADWNRIQRAIMAVQPIV